MTANQVHAAGITPQKVDINISLEEEEEEEADPWALPAFEQTGPKWKGRHQTVLHILFIDDPTKRIIKRIINS